MVTISDDRVSRSTPLLHIQNDAVVTGFEWGGKILSSATAVFLFDATTPPPAAIRDYVISFRNNRVLDFMVNNRLAMIAGSNPTRSTINVTNNIFTNNRRTTNGSLIQVNCDMTTDDSEFTNNLLMDNATDIGHALLVQHPTSVVKSYCQFHVRNNIVLGHRDDAFVPAVVIKSGAFNHMVAYNTTWDNLNVTHGWPLDLVDPANHNLARDPMVNSDGTLAVGSLEVDSGDPDPSYVDGTPNDRGAFGGPQFHW